MAFTKEADFEEAVVKLLIERGWKDGVLKNYTEQQLIRTGRTSFLRTTAALTD